jgi:predicted small metal-binding protein
MREIQGEELGVADCTFVARGETAREVVEAMTEHLEAEHGIDMPSPDVIVEDYPTEEMFLEKLSEVFTVGPDKETRITIQRMRTALNIDQE